MKQGRKVEIAELIDHAVFWLHPDNHGQLMLRAYLELTRDLKKATEELVGDRDAGS